MTMIFKKRKIVPLLILLLLIASLILGLLNLNKNRVTPNKPSLNQPDIIINTPENITYSEPMAGYYLASFGFEDEMDGTNGTDISFITTDTSPVNCYGEVIGEIDGHKKILKVYDGNTGGECGLINAFELAQQSGTIDYWIYTPDTWYVNAFELWEGGMIGIFVRIYQDKFQFRQPSHFFANITTASDNTWYHVQIDFECGSGGYLGLIANTFYVWINGIQYGPYPFYNSVSALDFIRLSTNLEESGSEAYYDAIGFSWDPYYSIGGNTNEGLLLSFEETFTEEWLGYSLDGLTNHTILGNVTIKLPTNGIHTIQLFGNDTIGISYDSDIRYFIIDYHPISIKTPENITYSGPMAGYYPATFGFEDEMDGTNGTDISFITTDTSPANCYGEIVGEVDGHKKILKVYDGNTGGECRLINDFELAQQSGTVDYWIYTPDTWYVNAFELWEGGVIGIFVRIYQDKFQFRQPSHFFANITTASDNTWYHVRIDFECGSGGYLGLVANTFYIWINGIQYGPYPFYNSVSALDFIRLSTNLEESGSEAYYDAIGLSWDPYYSIGGNRNEGLLLSFKSDRYLKVFEYSLDKHTKVKILGNITVPFLNDGSHLIQVFGNDSFETRFESELTYFSIDTTAPIIIINIPDIGEFFGVNAPNFEISINEPNLNTTWYSLDSGMSIFSFTGLTGIINQTEWENYSDGPITIRFYANDSFGFEDYTPITIYKDITPPISMISYTTYKDPNVVLKSTEFTLTSNDGVGAGISIIRYKINNSGWIMYTIPFTLAGYELGDYLITYQAVDNVGNIESENTLLVKLKEKPSEPEISGYNLYIIIGFIGIILLIFIRRRLKIK